MVAALSASSSSLSRPLREGVGRNTPVKVKRHCHSGRPLREGVGRNLAPLVHNKRGIRRPLREGVGRNYVCQIHLLQIAGRPLREGVGRNWSVLDTLAYPYVALYARAWVEIQMVTPISSPRMSPSTRGRG